MKGHLIGEFAHQKIRKSIHDSARNKKRKKKK